MKINFSCILSVYNRKDLYNSFEYVIQSVFQNTVTPKFMYIVVDGPVNAQFKKKILQERKKNKYIKLIWLKKNVGEAQALNKIIPKIKSEWIVKLDGDDLSYKFRFEEQQKYMKKNYDLIGGHVDEIDRDSGKKYIKNLPLNFRDIKKYARYRNPFNHMTVAYKKSTFLKLGGYPEIFLKEDYALWALFIKNNCKIINLKQSLVRVHDLNYIKRRGGLRYIFAEIKLQKHLAHCNISNLFFAIVIGFLRSLIFFFNYNIKSFIYKFFLRSIK